MISQHYKNTLRPIHFRKITYLPAKEIPLANTSERKFKAYEWNYKRIYLDVPEYSALHVYQKEKLKQHFIKEISEIAIGDSYPFQTLPHSLIGELLNCYEEAVNWNEHGIRNRSLLDFVFSNAPESIGFLEKYFLKNLAKDKYFLGKKRALKVKRKKRLFRKTFHMKRKKVRRPFIQEKLRKGASRKLFSEMVKRKARMRHIRLPKLRFGVVIINIKRRNAFLTLARMAKRTKGRGKFEKIVRKYYLRTLKSFSIGHLRFIKDAQKPVWLHVED